MTMLIVINTKYAGTDNHDARNVRMHAITVCNRCLHCGPQLRDT